MFSFVNVWRIISGLTSENFRSLTSKRGVLLCQGGDFLSVLLLLSLARVACQISVKSAYSYNVKELWSFRPNPVRPNSYSVHRNFSSVVSGLKNEN